MKIVSRLMSLAVPMLVFAFLAGCTPGQVPTSPAQPPTPTQSASPPVSPTLTPAATSPAPQLITVVSVTGPIPPLTPGGPSIEIALKNISPETVTKLSATLQVARGFAFDFGVSSSQPLLPGASVSATRALIGAGFSNETAYLLAISGALKDGTTFSYTRQVQITPPSPTPSPGTTVALTAITIDPKPGSVIVNSQNESSQVLLEEVMVSQGPSGKQYFSPAYPGHTVNIGETILVITGRVQNQHQQNKEIAMYAEGYDGTGKQVSWTIDTAHISGQIGLSLGQNEPGTFIIHMNMAENLKTIRIFANTYPITPP